MVRDGGWGERGNPEVQAGTERSSAASVLIVTLHKAKLDPGQGCQELVTEKVLILLNKLLEKRPTVK